MAVARACSGVSPLLTGRHLAGDQRLRGGLPAGTLERGPETSFLSFFTTFSPLFQSHENIFQTAAPSPLPVSLYSSAWKMYGGVRVARRRASAAAIWFSINY